MNKNENRLRRARSTRSHIRKLAVARLSVHRTGQHLYAQVFDASGRNVVAAASTLQKSVAEGLTGTKNVAAAVAVGKAVAAQAKCKPGEIFQASTGVIGEPLNPAPIVNALPKLFDSLSTDAWADAARAIMTTDTFPKAATRKVDIDPVTAAVADTNLRPWPDSRAREGYAEFVREAVHPLVDRYRERNCGPAFCEGNGDRLGGLAHIRRVVLRGVTRDFHEFSGG